jgi:hypothetical protein
MHQRRPIWVGAIAAALGVLLIAAVASADTSPLQLKRLEGDPNMWTPQTMMYRSTSSQSFFAYIGDVPGYTHERPDVKIFKEIVKKEPVYVSKTPFKGAAKLGGKQFAFVFDASKEGEKKYDRLYFDLNGNGDLTDDKVIEPAKSKNAARIMYSAGYSQSAFGPVEIALDVNGTKVDYAFHFSCMSNFTSNVVTTDAKGKRETRQMAYVNAQLNAAVYREGEITIDGKKRKVVLLDNNCNGTFDDPTTVMNVSGPGARAYPSYGDVLLIDPDSNPREFTYDLTASTSRQLVSKLLSFDGKIYDMTVSPGGDKLTIEPSSVPVGYVTNPNAGFRALIYGDKGVLRVAGGKDKKTPVPEGEWKLAMYTIDMTGWEPPKEPAKEAAGEAKAAKSTSLLESLSKALSGSAMTASRPRSGPTRLSAAAAANTKSVTVRKDETVEMPFGPPLKPSIRVAYVNAQPGAKEPTVQLELSLAGSSGEQCTDLMVNGGRPDKPEFTITSAKGEVVQKGSFEYG